MTALISDERALETERDDRDTLLHLRPGPTGQAHFYFALSNSPTQRRDEVDLEEPETSGQGAGPRPRPRPKGGAQPGLLVLTQAGADGQGRSLEFFALES